METVVIFASTKKESIEIAKKNHKNAVYKKPYKYSSKGNNFYLFELQKKYFVTIHFTSTSLNWLSRNFEILAPDEDKAMEAAENKVKQLRHFQTLSGGDCALCYQS